MRRIICLFLLLPLLPTQGQTPYEYVPDASDSLIEARLKLVENELPLTFNEHVKKYIHYYTVSHRETTKKLMSRSTKYFPLFEKYLRAYNLPDELKYLAVIESGLNPSAKSRAAAVGLWQFIYQTGQRYDLGVSWYLDDRMDPEKATIAACRFLSWLYGYHGDWELSLAAYNAGSGRVNRAIRSADESRAYYTIFPFLPRETRGYIPKLVATIYTFKYAAAHNLFPEYREYLPEYDTIHAKEYLSLASLSEALHLCPEDLVDLNPQVRYGTIPKGADGYPIKVPLEIKDSIVLNREALYAYAQEKGREAMKKLSTQAPAGTKGRSQVVYTVRSGDVLSRIAERHHVRVADIKAWNRLSSNLIRVGQKLHIYVGSNYQVTQTKTVATPTPSTRKPVSAATFVPVPGQQTYYVQPGDTLWSISKAWSVPIEQIKSMNNLSSDRIKPGQVLVLKGT